MPTAPGVLVVALTLLIAAIAAPAQAQAQAQTAPTAAPSSASGSFAGDFDGRWHVDLTPYVWLPTIDTKAQIPAFVDEEGETELQATPHDYLQYLRFALMGTAVARKGNFTLWTDAIALNLSGSGVDTKTVTLPPVRAVSVSLQSQARVVQTILTLGAGYTVARSATSSLDVLVGARYFGTTTTLGAQLYLPAPLPALTTNVTDTANGVDAIAGIAGRIGLGGGWYVPYHFDAGTGSTNFTWQGILALAHPVGHGAVLIGLRNLYYNTSRQHIVKSVNFFGPAIGYDFRL